MPDSTANFSFNLPKVNNAEDEDLWGDQLNENWVDTDALLVSLLAAIMPASTMMSYAGPTAPAGFLLCYGQEVSRTTYATLYAVIGDDYGNGDGSTTFNVPDRRGNVGVGLDNMGGVSANRVTDAQADVIGGMFGAETHTLTTAQTPAHTHSISTYGGASFDNGKVSGNATSAILGSATTSSVGSGNAHNNLQPGIAFNYIIKT